jgi:sec-independent protein translocase protein TatA
MGEFSLFHWVIVLAILLIFFGPSKLPGLGKGLGEAIRGFKKGLDGSGDPAADTNAKREEITSTDPAADKLKSESKKTQV